MLNIVCILEQKFISMFHEMKKYYEIVMNRVFYLGHSVLKDNHRNNFTFVFILDMKLFYIRITTIFLRVIMANLLRRKIYEKRKKTETSTPT